ncbi:sigma-54-dependent Fis family transcriptional regulator [Jannaschia sp. M317]|uniref:sigma-54-dependent Fis family transcriptional regulator n=1 Tax=Jannaschia sp. M317 TaxID=2867011 RepID=UPI0021A5C198|nr:GAF domain-containing protein [Jannaschia sp. M317]UWQ17056.1 GAF domain-containing protein [Jannaschia sp. M317]
MLESEGIFQHDALPAAIANSWARCLGKGLDPRAKSADAAVSHSQLREAKEKHEILLSVVRPELELLSNQISGTNHMVAYADTQGVVLEALMDHQFQESACSRSVRCGTIWTEDLRGTNGLGLALHTGEPSAVSGAEHFLAGHAGVSCVAAPIFDSQGRLIGLLDVSSELPDRQNHTQALVSLAASNIENRLFVNDHRGDAIIQFHPRQEYLTTQSVGMVSVDEDGRITGANRSACQLFNGIDLSGPKMFSDLFRGGFGAIVSQTRLGEVVRLVDWLNASYFARMRFSHPRIGDSITHKRVSLSTSPVFSIPQRSDDPVFHDGRVRNSMRLAIRSAKARLPICVSGQTGSGRTTFAQSVHQSLATDGPLVTIDCSHANYADKSGPPAELITELDTRRDILDHENGMLVVENLAAMRGPTAGKIMQFIDRLQMIRPNWCIMSTAVPDDAADREWTGDVLRTYENLTQMTVHLPTLEDRNDFALVAANILAGISSKHRLSSSAMSLLQKFDRPRNMSDLANQLRLLVVHSKAGNIREEHVERILGLPTVVGHVCLRCRGNSVREAKCREINRMYNHCSGNVALTSRTLGVSRTTVYSHVERKAVGGTSGE